MNSSPAQQTNGAMMVMMMVMVVVMWLPFRGVCVLLGSVCQVFNVDDLINAIRSTADALHMDAIEGQRCHTHDSHLLRHAETLQHWCVNSLVANHESLSHCVTLVCCVVVVCHDRIIPSVSSIVKANR